MKQYLNNPRILFYARLAMAFWLACVGSIKIQAQDIISFAVETGTAGTTRNWMFPADRAGAPGVRTNNWNNIGNYLNGGSGNADASLLPGNITNAAGALVPGVGALIHNTSGGAFGDRGAGTTNDSKMFLDVCDGYGQGTLSGYGYLYVTNIPYTNYNVYVYFLPDGTGATNTRGGVFCITNAPTGTNCIYMKCTSNDLNNTQVPVPSSSSFATAYVRSMTTSIAAGGVAWSTIDGGNYGTFYGLTNSACKIMFAGLGNGSGGGKDPFGNYVNGGSTVIRFKVAGFQIYQVPAAAPTNLYLLNSSIILHAGNPVGTQMTVLANLSDGTLGVGETINCTYSVDNTNVATVTASGSLSPVTNGTANLIVQLASAGLSITNPISVIGPTSVGIALASTNLLVGNGQGDQTMATLTANYSDASGVIANNYKFVAFNTSPAGVLTVTSNGILTAIGVGAANVVASYDGLSVTSSPVFVTAYSAPGNVPSFGVKVTDANHAMAFHDLSGAPGVRFGYWNNMPLILAGATNTLNTPVDYHGAALPGTVVELTSGPALALNIFTTAGTPTTNESSLFDTYLDEGMGNGTTVSSTLVVSNVPYSSYDVYFYFYNDNSSTGTNRPGQVTIDGVTQYRNNSPALATQPDNSGNGYVIAAPQPSGLPTSVANVPYGNVIKFSGIMDTDLIATWAAVGQDYIGDAGATTRIRLVGFQIVKSLTGLNATNVYLSPAPVSALLAGNPATQSLTAFADFSDGTKAGNITTLSGIGYASSDTGVFAVDANGVITPGLTPGVATLTVTYQTNTLNVSVTNLGPTSVNVTASPATVYLDGNLGISTAQATAYANFPGHNNVNIGGFSGVTFEDQGSAVASMTSAGALTGNSAGQANLGVSYLGMIWVSTNAFTVGSIANPPVLKHLYLFTNAANSTVVKDLAGAADGAVFPALGTNMPITFDGARAIFPGTADYSTAPYISLTPGIINQSGDVTIELWGGQSQHYTWARFFGFGNTPKGLDPHNYGGTAPSGSLQLIAANAPQGVAEFAGQGNYMTASFALTNGAEYHMVVVVAPNANVLAYYINGVLIANSSPMNQLLSASVNDQVDWLGVSLSNNDAPLAGWMNKLAIYEGAMSASQVSSNYAAGVSLYLPPVTISTLPTNIVTAVSGKTLTLSWPADHLGWKLQVQTNSLSTGLGTNWVIVPGSETVTSTNITINPANGSTFYRLTYP